MKLNEFLKNKRIKEGITQRELSTDLGYSTCQFVSNWERGLCSPPLEKAKEICVLLNINVNLYKKKLLKDYTDKINSIIK